jgi:hypothetical protein
MTTRWRLAALAGIVLVQFAVFEAALRIVGGSEAAPAFQRLFLDDPVIGYRLRPSTAVRFTTSDFSTDISINRAGVRDEELGSKGPNERRIVVLGDSLVLAVQVPLEQTFCKRLEAALNARATGTRYRVINAGVQGYGPIEEALFFERVVAPLEPDLVIVVTFVANDAVEAFEQSFRLRADGTPGRPSSRQIATNRIRRIVRSSMVLQIARQRVDSVRDAFRWAGEARPDLRLLTYASPEPPEIAGGLDVSRTALRRIADDASRLNAKTAIVLMPARFQLDDEELQRLRGPVEQAGYQMDVDAATRRFATALAPLHLSMLDLLEVFRRSPDPTTIFFASTAHLTPRGHAITGDSILTFLDAQGLTP